MEVCAHSRKRNSPIIPHAAPECIDLIEKLIAYDPDERWGSAEISQSWRTRRRARKRNSPSHPSHSAWMHRSHRKHDCLWPGWKVRETNKKGAGLSSSLVLLPLPFVPFCHNHLIPHAAPEWVHRSHREWLVATRMKGEVCSWMEEKAAAGRKMSMSSVEFGISSHPSRFTGEQTHLAFVFFLSIFLCFVSYLLFRFSVPCLRPAARPAMRHPFFCDLTKLSEAEWHLSNLPSSSSCSLVFPFLFICLSSSSSSGRQPDRQCAILSFVTCMKPSGEHKQQ